MLQDTSVKYANFSQRLLAFNIDLTIFLFTILPALIFIEDDKLFFGMVLVAICLYHASFECSGWQATPGKKYSGLIVVNQQGGRLQFFSALLRIVTKYLSLLLFFGGFFMIYLRADRRGLHDRLVKTYVLDIR